MPWPMPVRPDEQVGEVDRPARVDRRPEARRPRRPRSATRAPPRSDQVAEVRPDDVGDDDRAVVAVGGEDRPDRGQIVGRGAGRISNGRSPAGQRQPAVRRRPPEPGHRLEQPVVGQGVGGDPVAAGHRLAPPTRALTIASSVASIVASNSAPIAKSFSARMSTTTPRVGPERRPRQRPVAGREAQEQVAARVGPGAAHPGDPEPGPLGEPLALVGQERRVGRDDDDDRAGAGAAAIPAVATGASSSSRPYGLGHLADAGSPRRPARRRPAATRAGRSSPGRARRP